MGQNGSGETSRSSTFCWVGIRLFYTVLFPENLLGRRVVKRKKCIFIMNICICMAYIHLVNATYRVIIITGVTFARKYSSIASLGSYT